MKKTSLLLIINFILLITIGCQPEVSENPDESIGLYFEKETPTETTEYLTFDGVDYPIDSSEIEVWCYTVEDLLELSRMSELINLKLHLIMTEDFDLMPLAELTKLEYLYIIDSPGSIKDLSPLSSLTRLNSLTILSRRITDITALESLTNLANLSLSTNHLVDISPLASLSNLETLSLNPLGRTFGELSDISPLSGLTTLSSLDLWNNLITDISPLKGLSNLEYLNLNQNMLIATEDVNELAEILPNCEIRFEFREDDGNTPSVPTYQ